MFLAAWRTDTLGRGNFTEYCDNCHIIQEGQSDTQVGHILCSCGPKGSDVKLEYIYDLSKSLSLLLVPWIFHLILTLAQRTS